MEVVRLLAKLGVNVKTPNNDSAMPAYIAAQNGHFQVVRLLAEFPRFKSSSKTSPSQNVNDAEPELGALRVRVSSCRWPN